MSKLDICMYRPMYVLSLFLFHFYLVLSSFTKNVKVMFHIFFSLTVFITC